MLFALSSAILGILAFLPFGFFWLFGFVFLIPLFVFFIKEEKLWRLILGTFVFRLVLATGTVYFTFEPIIWISSIFIFLGLPISVFAVKKIIKKTPFGQLGNRLLFILPILWTLFDHLQARYSLLPTYLMTAGNIFGSSPFAGLANFTGLLSLTFFAAVINSVAALLIIGFLKEKQLILKFPKFNFYLPIILILLFSLIAAWWISQSQLQKNKIAYDNFTDFIRIAVVSTRRNFSSPDFFQLKRELLGKKNNFDFLILPEDILDKSIISANDAVGNSQDDSLYVIENLAKELNKKTIATLDTVSGEKRYNSAVLFDENGNIADVYHKRRLTFMGEYWPFDWQPFYLNWLKKFNPESKNYAIFNPQKQYVKGEMKILSFDYNKKIQFASPICLEIHYPNDLKKMKESGAKFLINPTSNRWIDIGANHFLYLTNNLRKIESIWLKTPIVSSGVIDSAGIFTPGGKINSDYFESSDNYVLFIGEIRY